MKKNIFKKPLTSLTILTLVIGFVSPTVISGDEIEEPTVNETETVNIDEVEETEAVEEVNEEVVSEAVEQTVNVQATSDVVALSSTSLVADTTTLGSAFPDVNFRTYVAETVLGKTAGAYDSTTTLSTTDISKISNFTTVNVSNKEIVSMEGIQYFDSITTLSCGSNQITELDVSSLTTLTSLNCYMNQISELDVSNLTSLTNLSVYYNNISVLDTSNLTNLVHLNCYMNPISELIIPEVAKANIKTLNYRHTNVDTLDLTGFTSITGSFGITKATNADVSKVAGIYSSGSRVYSDSTMVRLVGSAGTFSWDSNTGYYVIPANSNATYGFAVANNDGGWINVDNLATLENGALMDNEGNLIIGASTSDVLSDGTIKLSNGGTIATPEGTFVFSGSVSIKDGIITTQDNYTFAKNTSTENDSGTYTANIGDIVTAVEVNGGEVSIDSDGSDMSVPGGSVVTTDSGDKIYVIDDATVDSEGNVTTDNTLVTVPSENVNDITVDSDGNILFPGGSIVTIGDEEVVYPENIVYNSEDNTLEYLPIDTLLSENGTNIADAVDQSKIDEAQDVIDQLPSGTLKDELQSKVDTAQDMLDAKTMVDDLYDENGDIKESVTQEDLDNAQKGIDKLPDGELKDELQEKVDKAQDMLDAKEAVDDLFNPDGSIKDDVSQEDIDNAQKKIDKLPDGELKEQLQNKINDAQKQIDEKEFVVISGFEIFTGKGTVSAKIDAPVEKFNKVYINGEELDSSNYEVTSGSTVITLKESYLLTLTNKTYNVEVEFTSGARISIPLTVNVASNASVVPPTNSKPVSSVSSSTSGSNVNTGDTTDLTLLYTILAVSLLGVAVGIKRKYAK